MDLTDAAIENGVKKPSRKPVVFWAALGMGIMAILATIWLTEFDATFGNYFAALFIEAVFASVFVWTIVHVCRKQRYKRISGYVPILFLILGAVISCTVPFEKYLWEIDTHWNMGRRIEVVEKIRSGEWKVFDEIHGSGKVVLPWYMRYLSKGGGEVMVEKEENEMYVLFFRYRGVLDHFSGYMYRSDDSMPRSEFGGDYFEVIRLQPNWYWAASH